MSDIENVRDPVDVFVGARLRTFRKSKRLSLEELGSSVGLAYQQIQKYEHGVNRISASKLWQLSRVLGVSVEVFFPGSGCNADPEAIAIATRMRRLNPEIRNIVIELIDAVAAASNTR